MVVLELCYSLSTILVFAVVWWFLEYFKFNKYLNNFPGPWPLPVIGNAYNFSLNKDISIEILYKFQQKYGGITKYFFGYTPRLVLSDAKGVEFLLNSSTILDKPYEYKFLRPWLGTGLLTSTGDHWKRQRRLLTPTFHFQILEQFLEVFNTQSDVLTKKLQKEVNNTGFDIFPYISLCTLDTICESAMETTVDVQNNPQSEYMYSVKEMLRIIVERLRSPLKMYDLFFYFSRDYQKQQNALKILLEYTKSVIRKRRELFLQEENSKSLDGSDMRIKKKLAFLDLLLDCSVDGKQLPDSVIEDEVNTFMFEGHDTVASAMSFALYCLSKNPIIQDKIVEELRNIFPDDKERRYNYQDLQKMKYLEMVIKESMRLYPPVPIISRILNEDCVYDGKILPKGLACMVFIYSLHRQPDVFPDAEVFDPERFAPENTKNRSSFAYVPFSAGPRNCIGQRFAMLEMKSTLLKILKKYKIIEVPNHSPKFIENAVLKSGNGLYLRIQKRNF